MIAFGLSAALLAGGVLGIDVVGYAIEWRSLGLLNDLRAAGYTCPDGTVYPPNPVPLEWNCKLWRAARLHAEDMATRNYFEHQSLPTAEHPDGLTPWERAAAQGTTASSENIAAGNNDPELTLEQWKTSNGHCKNMMNAEPSRKSMAVGYSWNWNSEWNYYWVQMFSSEDGDYDDGECAFVPTEEPTPMPTGPPVPTPPPTQFPTFAIGTGRDEMNYSEMRFLQLINEYRVNGVTCDDEYFPPVLPLTWNCGLWRASRDHVQYLVDERTHGRDGPDGLTHQERAASYGADGECGGYQFGGTYEDYYGTPELVFGRFTNCCCHIFMQPRVKSIGHGYAFNPDNASANKVDGGGFGHNWTIMISNQPTFDDLKWCYDDGNGNNPVTPEPSAEPTMPPTNPPTDSPTGSPTESPTPSPTRPPTRPPTDDTVIVANCDAEDKTTCKADINCSWKSSACKKKTKTCKSSWSQDKCDKKDCDWIDETCGWVNKPN